MNTSEVLNRAADHIERYGWWQNGRERDANSNPLSACASNAVTRVVTRGRAGDMTRAHEALWTHLGVGNLPGVFEWNDAPDRTAAEVIETLRACAVIEAARESELESVTV